MRSGFYEQIKADLGYLRLDAAAASFAVLAEEARTNDWSHIEFLARLVAEQATADRDRRLAARLRYARFAHRRRLDDLDFEFQPSVEALCLSADTRFSKLRTVRRPVRVPGCSRLTL